MHCVFSYQEGFDKGLSAPSASCNGTDDPCRTGNPVLPGSGSKVDSAVDFSTVGASVLELKRYYSSAAGGSVSLLGNGWRFSFESLLDADGWTPQVTMPNGKVYTFARIGETLSYKLGEGQEDVSLVQYGNPPVAYELTTGDDVKIRFEPFTTGETRSFKPVWIKDRSGYQLNLTYFQTAGLYHRVQSVSDNLGRTLTFTLDSNGTLASASAPGGVTINYSFGYAESAAGVPVADTRRLTGVSIVNGPTTETTTYHYENATFPYALTGITDGRGVRFATYTYDDLARVVDEVHAGGADHITFGYTGTSTTVTNPLGKSTVYNFNTILNRRRLVGMTGAASANCPASASQIAYDTSTGYVAQMTDEEGRVTDYARDSRGQPTTITRGYGTPEATSTYFTYDATLHVLTQIAEPGRTTNYTWDTATGRLTSKSVVDTTTQTVPYSTSGQTRSWAYTYTTAAGLLASVDGPLAGTGDTVSYTYDAAGFVKTVTNEVGHVTTINTVNGRGQPTQVTDPNGVVSNLTYDVQGRLKTMTVNPGASQAVTSFDYDQIGQITKIARPDGSYLTYTYNSARRLTQVAQADGQKIEYTHDAMGNITGSTIKGSDGTITFRQTQTFDELGRLLKQIGAATQETVYAYEKNDNLKSVTDPRGGLYSYAYDAVNRLIRETDQGNAQINYTRDGKDDVTVYTDPRNFQTTYIRNGFSEVIQQTSPDSGTMTYVRNALGLPTQVTDGRGIVTNLTYDNAGRILTKTFPAATAENITYTYDDITTGNKGKGRLTKVASQNVTVEWVYDARGNIITDKRTIATKVHTTSYVYNAADLVTQITYPSGRLVTYTRDSMGRITSVATKQNATAASVTLASSIDYMPVSKLVKSLNYGNGLNDWNTFTQDYEIDVLGVYNGPANVCNVAHTRTDKLNVTNLWDNVTTSNNQSLWYHPTNRLQNADGPWGSRTYYYDGVGNRTQEISTPPGSSTSTTRTYSYPATNNKLSSVVIGASTTERSFTYDGAGNITQDSRSGTAYVYAYNKRNRLNTVTVAASLKGTYTYNGLEQLAIRVTTNQTPAGTTHFIHDIFGNVIAETAGGGATGATGTVREYIWLPETEIAPTKASRTVVDRPLAVVNAVNTASPATWYVHVDLLNRPIKMTDGAKASVWNAVWQPWGSPQSITGTATLDARFPGQWYQLEAGLHYNWNRHYDPTIGRYTQTDPLGFVDGPSVFAYAGSAPHRWVDRDGRQAVPVPHPAGLLLIPPALYCAAFPEKCRKLGEQCEALLRKVLGGSGDDRDDGERCKKVIKACSSKCSDLYAEDRENLPGSGSDFPGRIRQCIRECAELEGCSGF